MPHRIFDDIRYEDQLITINMTIFSIRNDRLSILLLKRNKEPYNNLWMIPGGAMYNYETCENAVRREMKEKLNISSNIKPFLSGVFSDPKRDPRFRNLSITYWCMTVAKNLSFKNMLPKYSDADWIYADEVKKLAFDHNKLLETSLGWLREKAYDIGFMRHYLPSPFTLGQLQRIYESIFATKLDKRNFRRKLNALDCLDSTGVKNQSDPRRKSLLYTFKT